MLSNGQRLLKTVEPLVDEEYFRELARIKAREDYETSGGKIILMHDELVLGLKSIKSASSTDHISVSHLIDRITGFDLFHESEGKKRIANAEQKLKELLMGPASEYEKRNKVVRERTFRN